MEALRESLMSARAAITGDIRQLEEETLGLESSGGGEEGIDDLYSQEFSLELLEHDEGTLRLISEAIERMDEGEYGRCLVCGDWIGKERLRAVPYAANCIHCQRQLELEAS